MSVRDAMRITTVLLDLDDTIVDEESGRVVARELLARKIVARHPHLDPVHIRVTFDQISKEFWSDAERHRMGRLNIPGARQQVFSQMFQMMEVPDPAFEAEVAEQYQRWRDDALVFCPGALEALTWLRANHAKLGMITNGAGPPQRAKVARFGLARFFDHIQVEGELGRGKPDLAAFRHALAALGARPEETVMIGNNREADILPALELGIRAVHIDAGDKGDDRRYWRINGISEVRRLLSGW